MTPQSIPSTIELYMFKVCPFAQRALIALIKSGLAYDTIILNPAEIPADFNNISPLGNVPVLRINRSKTIFESSVITDYIAQISPLSMEPEDEISRAQMRAWNEYGASCFGAMMQLLKAEDEDAMKQANEGLITKLNVVADQMEAEGPYFYGEKFTTIDATYAPLFFRMKTLNGLFDRFSFSELPTNMLNWMGALLESDELQKSIIGDFTMIYRTFISKQAGGGYINKQLSV